MSGKVVHFEIPADDTQRAKQFYRDAFGWQLEDMPGTGYTMVTAADSDEHGASKVPGAINGGMYQRQSPLSQPLVVVDVEDLDKGIERVEQLGGVIVKGRQDMGAGYTAYFTDTEGNTIGLWQNKR